MTYTELVEEISRHTDIPKTKVALVLNSFIVCTRKAVLSGRRVNLIGFGYFYAMKQQPKELFGGKRKQGNHIIRFRESRHGKRTRRQGEVRSRDR